VHRDLGVMLLDFAAYVLAVTGFYDARIAERAYLAPAPDAATVQEIVALIGYVPRPAMVARMRIALEAAGADPVAIPPGTAFRSDAFGEEPAQIFEALAAGIVWPQRNRWHLAPIPETDFNGTLLFGTGAVPHQGAVLALATTSLSKAAAGLVREVRPVRDGSGTQFRRVRLDAAGSTAVMTLSGTPTADLEAHLMRITGGLSPHAATPISVSGKTATLHLDAVYGQIRADDIAVLEAGGALFPGKVTTVITDAVQVTRTIDGTELKQTVLQTRVTLDLLETPTGTARARLHFNPARMGPLLARGKETVTLSDMASGAILEGPVTALGEAPALGSTLLQGTARRGAEISATVARNEDDSGRLAPGVDAKDFAAPLMQPLTAFGNVIEITRGERVLNEVLGSSDGQSPYQRYTLRKKPLSWIESAADSTGRSPFIDVAVDGIRWRRVGHLTEAGPEDRVYALIARPDGDTQVAFGDGVNGAIPPGGVANIVALSYRHGGGAAKPPAGTVSQFKRPVRGVSRIHSPLGATGGADAEGPDELKQTAPGFALTLDRAVSVADFEAMAHSYSGILNAQATWGWEVRRQRALVRIAMIPDAGDPSAELRDYLEARAAPGLAVEVTTAQGQSLPLAIDLVKSADHLAETVAAEAETALLDPFTGFLVPRRIRIGAPLLRSELVARLHAVPGVTAVASIRLGGAELGLAATPSAPFSWFDFTSQLGIGVSDGR
jgi:predicted phage baseplate assembly protein